MVRITCINKDGGDHFDPHEGITRFGWVNEQTNSSGITDRTGMITYLENGGQAFVRDRFGTIATLVVRVRLGRQYVKTVADGRDTDNLLALGECPL